MKKLKDDEKDNLKENDSSLSTIAESASYLNTTKLVEYTKLLILIILDLFSLRKSGYPLDYLSRIDQEINKNCFLVYKKKEKISTNSIIKLNDNTFLLYNKKSIMIYNSLFNKELYHHTFPSPVIYISESKCFIDYPIIISLKNGKTYKLETKSKTIDEIVICMQNDEENKGRKKGEINKAKKFIKEIKKQQYIFSTIEGTYFFDNQFDKKGKAKRISDETFEIGEIINDKYILLFYNMNNNGIIKYLDFNNIKEKNGKNKIETLTTFYNEIILNQNCISLMNLENRNFKILLCACKNRIEIVKLKFNNNGILKRKLYNYSIDLNGSNINCLFPIENNYKDDIIINQKLFDSNCFIVNITNEENESEFRIYNLEGIEDDIIIQKGFIKSRISNDSDGNNKVFSINQISNNGDFVISMATDSEPKKGKKDEEITLSEKEKEKDKDKIIVKKDEQNNKTELESKASEGLIKIYKFETLLSTEEDITV